MQKIFCRTILLLFILALCLGQYSKKSSKTASAPNKGNVLEMAINTILGGPYDMPIATRIMNKAGHFASILFGSIGSVFAYFKWFRNKKSRSEQIDEFIAQQKIKFALTIDEQMKKVDKKAIDLKMYTFNQEKDRTIAINSTNNQLNFNIDVVVQEAQENSPLIYDIVMKGNDPEGKSIFSGFVTFKDNLMEIRLEQTYETHDKNKEIPICFFEGRQTKKEEDVIQGEWWRDKQKGTKGSYSGKWTFTF